MKILLNDKEYYTDDFTPEQTELLKHIESSNNLMLPFRHALESMEAVVKGYTSQLAASLETVEKEDPEEKPKPKRKPQAKKA